MNCIVALVAMMSYYVPEALSDFQNFHFDITISIRVACSGFVLTLMSSWSTFASVVEVREFAGVEFSTSSDDLKSRCLYLCQSSDWAGDGQQLYADVRPNPAMFPVQGGSRSAQSLATRRSSSSFWRSATWRPRMLAPTRSRPRTLWARATPPSVSTSTVSPFACPASSHSDRSQPSGRNAQEGGSSRERYTQVMRGWVKRHAVRE